MVNKIEKLIPGAAIHTFGRTNGKDKMFHTDASYQYFLERYKFQIMPMVDTLCYFLHINHFHFVIRVKEMGTIDISHPSFTKKQLTLFTEANSNNIAAIS